MILFPVNAQILTPLESCRVTKQTSFNLYRYCFFRGQHGSILRLQMLQHDEFDDYRNGSTYLVIFSH